MTGYTVHCDGIGLMFMTAGRNGLLQQQVVCGPVKIFKLIPKSVRNYLYDLASNRYSLVDKKEFCRIPSPAERKRFLL